MKEKTLELNVMEQRATTTERALELAKQKAEGFQGKLGETEVKLAERQALFLLVIGACQLEEYDEDSEANLL